MKNFGDYKFLAGRRGVTGSLWEGKDHFLLLQRAGFLLALTEQYKRIDYDKIEAVTAAKTKRGLIWTIVFACLLAPLFLILTIALMNQSYTVAGILGGLILAVGLILLIHLRAGATCSMTIQTAVASHVVTPVGRWRDVERLLGRMDELIGTGAEQRDPKILDEMLAAEMTPSNFATVPAAMPVLPVQRSSAEPEIKPWQGRRITWLAGAFSAVAGALLAAELEVNFTSLTLFVLFSSMAAFVMALIALVKVLGRRAPSGLLAVLITEMVLLVLGGIAGYAAFVIAAFKGEVGANSVGMDSTGLLRVISAIDFETLGGWGFGILAIAVLIFLSGLVTMLILLKNPRSSAVIAEVEKSEGGGLSES